MLVQKSHHEQLNGRRYFALSLLFCYLNSKLSGKCLNLESRKILKSRYVLVF